MQILLSLSVAILAGLLMTRLAKPLGLPSVTAYLVAGVLIGPFCLGRLGIEGLGFTSMAEVERLSLVSDVALGFIAVSYTHLDVYKRQSWCCASSPRVCSVKRSPTRCKEALA